MAMLCLILSLPLFFLPAFTPDEVWFYRDSMAIEQQGIYPIAQLPHLGYGASFWLAYATLIRVLRNQMLVLYVARAFCFLLAASVPLLLIWEGRRIRSPFTLHSVVLWFALPMAWWTGKVVSPEIPSYVMVIYALLLVRERPTAAWLLWGLAAGLKLTALPAGAILWAIGQERNWTSASKAMGYAALGFVIGNPVLLFHPILFREAMLVAWEPWVVNIYTIFRMLFSTCWEWDGVPSGGIFVHGVCLLTVIMTFDSLWSEGKKDAEMRMAAKGFLCTWGITLILVLRSRFLLWYAFPALAIVPFGLLYLTKRSRYVTAAVFCQVLFGAPLIYWQYSQKLSHFRELRAYEELRAEVDPKLAEWHPDLVADLAVVGRLGNQTPAEGRQYLSEMASESVIQHGPESVTARMHGRLAIVLNRRLMGVSAIYDQFLKDLNNPKWAGKFKLVASGETKAARLFLFETDGAETARR